MYYHYRYCHSPSLVQYFALKCHFFCKNLSFSYISKVHLFCWEQVLYIENLRSVQVNHCPKFFFFFAEHGENMMWTKIVLNVRNNFCTQHVLPRFALRNFMYWTCNSMKNLSSYCGLQVDAKIRSSDKDLPVHHASVVREWTERTLLKKGVPSNVYAGMPRLLMQLDVDKGN